MADPVPTNCDGWMGTNGQEDCISKDRGGSDGSMFASTFGNFSGRLQQAVKMATTTSSSASTSISKQKLPSVIAKENMDSNEQLSETESATIDSMNCGWTPTVEDISILEAKVQILYGQLHDREITIRQLKEEQYRTLEEFEIFEKESVECMEELGTDIDDLKDKLHEREHRIRELESLQTIPEHLQGEHDGALQAELERLQNQLRAKETKVGETEGDHSGNGEAKHEASTAELRAQLKDMEEALKEKDKMIEKLEESESLTFGLVEERDEEIERLTKLLQRGDNMPSKNSQCGSTGKLEPSTGVRELQGQHKDMVDSPTKEPEQKDLKIQKLQDSLEMIENGTASMNEILEARDAQIDNSWQQNESDQEDCSTKVQELSQKVLPCNSHNNGLENERRRNNELIKELEALQACVESSGEGEKRCLAVKLDRLDNSGRTCRALQEKLDALSSEPDSKTSELKNAKALLLVVTSQCEQLTATVNMLTEDLKEREKKLLVLGFKCGSELIEVLHSTQQCLRSKEEELRKVTWRHSCVSHIALPIEVDGHWATQNRDKFKDDRKSIEHLLREQKVCRQELKARVKALTREMKNSGACSDSLASSADIHAFHFHISQKIVAIVDSLSVQDGIHHDLIKAFQLKLEHTSSLEKKLGAREAQIAMLVQELDELEQNRDNLCRSINSTSSNHTLLVSTKLEELLIDIHERDEKLSVLEWLTVDLSKTLETQTEEFEEYREKAEMQEAKQHKLIELLLGENKDSELEVEGMKTLVEANKGPARKQTVEARPSKESAKRKGLQSSVDSLKSELCDSENQVKALQMHIDGKTSQDKVQTVELKVMANCLKDSLCVAEEKITTLEIQSEAHRQKERQTEELEARVEFMTRDLSEAKGKVKALEMVVQANKQEVAQREGLYGFVAALAQDPRHADLQVASLAAEVKVKQQELTTQRDEHTERIDSLTNDLRCALNQIASLETEIESKNGFIQMCERLLPEVTSNVQTSLDDACAGAAESGGTNAAMELQMEEAGIRGSVVHRRLEERCCEIETLVAVSARHEQCMNELETEREATSGTVRHLEDDISASDLELQANDQIVGELTLAMQVSNEINEKLENKVQDAANTIDQLEQTKQENQKCKESLEKQVQEASKRTNQLVEAGQENPKLSASLESHFQATMNTASQLDQAKHQNYFMLTDSKLHSSFGFKDRKHGNAAVPENQLTDLQMRNMDLLVELNAQNAKLQEAQMGSAEWATLLMQQEGLQLNFGRLEEDSAETAKKQDGARAENEWLACGLTRQESQLKQFGALHSQVDELKQQNGMSLQDVKLQQSEVERVDKKAAEEARTANALEEHNTILQNNMESIVADALKDRTSSRQQLDAFTATHESLLESLKDRDRQNASLQSKLDSIVAGHLQSKSIGRKHIDKLSAERKPLIANLRAKDEECASMNGKFESLASANQKAKLVLVKQMDSLTADHAALLDNLKAKEKQMKEASKHASQMEELKEQNAKHLAGLKAWEGRVNELEGLVAAKDEVFQDMTVIEELLQKQKSCSQELLHKIDTLTTSLKDKETELELVKADKENHELVIKFIRQEAREHTQLQHECEAAKKKCAQVEQELDILTVKSPECDSKLGQATRLLTTEIHDHNELEGRHEEAEVECQMLGKQVHSSRQAHLCTTDMESQLELSKTECTRQQEIIGELTQRCQGCLQLKTDFMAKEQELMSKREEVKELTLCQDHSELESECNNRREEWLRSQNRVCALSQKCQTYLKLECEREIQTRECSKKQEKINELEKRCRNHFELELAFEAKKQECNTFIEDLSSLAQDVQRMTVEAEEHEKEIKSSLESKDNELKSLRALTVDHEKVVKELRAKSADFVLLQSDFSENEAKCRKLELGAEDLAQNLETTRIALVDSQVTVKRSLSTDRSLHEQVWNLQQEVNDLDSQVDELSKDKAALVDEVSAMQLRRFCDENKVWREHQQSVSQMLENMESLTEDLEERNKEIEALQSENAFHHSLVQKLREEIDGQANDMNSLTEDHGHECHELRTRLDTMAGELQASNLRLMKIESDKEDNIKDTKELEQDLCKVRRRNKATQAENEKVRGQLEAMGFESMDTLVCGLAAKCQEHDEMVKVIQDSNKKISSLQSDLEDAQKRAGPDINSLKRVSSRSVTQLHKIRELEMKMGLFRDEIAGKNAIIEDLTVRLHREGSKTNCSDHSTHRSLIAMKDAPGLRMKPSQPRKCSKKIPVLDDSASKTAKALSTIPELIKAITERDGTIIELQEKLESSKGAIEGLVKGLECNVQEKIEADRMVHAKENQCNEFASKVQHLKLKLEQLEEHKPQPMHRGMATMDEINSLSVSELVDLLRQSKALVEDLTGERERLIANATSMSIALAESRARVEVLLKNAEDEPGKIKPTATTFSFSCKTRQNTP